MEKCSAVRLAAVFSPPVVTKATCGKLRGDFGGGGAELVAVREDDVVALLGEVPERAFKLVRLQVLLLGDCAPSVFWMRCKPSYADWFQPPSVTGPVVRSATFKSLSPAAKAACSRLVLVEEALIPRQALCGSRWQARQRKQARRRKNSG